MNRKSKTVALLAVLSLAAVSCQKETVVDPVSATDPVTMRMVTYCVDGVTTQVTLLGDDAWDDFLHWMFALAEEGHRVSFRQGNAEERNAAKETVTFTTNSQIEAYNWANTMMDKGYEVTIEYDKKTGIYTCTATR